MRLFLLICAIALAAGTPVHRSSRCFTPSAMDITSQNGMLMMNGQQFNMKGMAWFGFETSNNCVHGLWAQDYKFLLDIMKNYSFNALRIPFHLDLALHDGKPASINFYQMNQDLKGLSSLQVMDKIIQAAGERGILVMLDMHSLEPGGYLNNGLWYDSKYSAAQNIQGWMNMVKRYSSQPNVIALDVFNEPFDATWGTGNATTDFDVWSTQVGNAVHDAGVKWLINVEGVANSPSCAQACFWGEDLEGVANHPIQLNTPNKVVYSPHVYGPNVATQTYFNDPSFPKNMPAIWNAHYGYIRKTKTAAIIPGEWGGQTTGKNGVWMNAFVDYMGSIGSRDSFFWCLNPDSGDTGGFLLNDWKTVDQGKAAVLARYQPNPTKVNPTLDAHGEIQQLCFE